MAVRALEVTLAFGIKPFDIDFAQHVSNITYIRWLEELRLEMLRQYLPLRGLIQSGLTPVLTETHIEYKRALKMFDEPVGKMWMTEVGGVRMSVEAEITSPDGVSAKAVQRGIFMHIATGRPARVPETLKAFYAAALQL
ncbi:MAG: acyl-CoA thioesterase [Rhizobacter sp.]|nr:acyl-CoA thioesterase [Chlorobiales bacterium]